MTSPDPTYIATVILEKIAEKYVDELHEAMRLIKNKRVIIEMYIGLHFIEPQPPGRISSLVDNMMKNVCKDQYSRAKKLCISGDNRYLVISMYTTVSDNILGEEIQGLINYVVMGEKEIDELLEDLGISKEYLDYITDITIEIIPLTNKPFKSLFMLIRRIYDYVNTYTRAQLSAKITITSQDDKILKKYTEKAAKLNLKTYRGNKRLTIILRPSQIIDKEIYDKLERRIIPFF